MSSGEADPPSARPSRHAKAPPAPYDWMASCRLQQERGLIAVARPGATLDRSSRARWIVLLADARLPRRGQRVTRDLARTLRRIDMNNNELRAIDARPDTLVDQGGRDRVERAADRDRRLPRHLARLTETHRVRDRRQWMQPLALRREHHRRRSARDPVLAGVHPITEHLARMLELGEVLIGRPQVVIGRDDVGLGDTDRRLGAALALRIRRDARRDRQPVMATDRHDLRVAHRDPAHVIDRHRLLVVSQRVGRRATKAPQRPI